MNGPVGTLSGSEADQRYIYVRDIRAMRKRIGKKLKLEGTKDYPKLVIKGKDYDKLFLEAKEGNPRFDGNDGIAGKHILCFDASEDGDKIYSGSSAPPGEIIVWDVKKHPKKILHRLPPLGWSPKPEAVKKPFVPYMGQSRYHSAPVTGVRVVEGVMATASLDGAIILWERIDSASAKHPPRATHVVTSSPSATPSAPTSGDEADGAVGEGASGDTTVPNSTPEVEVVPAGFTCLAVSSIGPAAGRPPKGSNKTSANATRAGPGEATPEVVEKYLTAALKEASEGLGGQGDQKKVLTRSPRPTRPHLLFAGDESGALTVWVVLPNAFEYEAPSKGVLEDKPAPGGMGKKEPKKIQFTPQPIKVASVRVGEGVVVTSLYVDRTRSVVFAGDMAGTVTAWDFSALLSLTPLDQPDGALVPLEELAKLSTPSCTSRIMALELHENKLFVGCLGHFLYPVGLVVEYLEDDGEWGRAYVIKVNHTPASEDGSDAEVVTYDLIVDGEYDGTQASTEGLWREDSVAHARIRTVKNEDTLREVKKGVRKGVLDAARGVDSAILAMSCCLEPSDLKPEDTSIVPENKVVKPSEVKLFADAAEAFVESTFTAADAKTNQRGLVGAVQTTSRMVADTTVAVGSTAVTTVAPNWLVRKSFWGGGNAPTADTTDAAIKASAPDIPHSLYVWDVADVLHDPPTEPLLSLKEHYAGVSSFTVDKDDRVLYSASFDKTIVLWKITGGPVKSAEGSPSPDGEVADFGLVKVGRISGFSGAVHCVHVHDGEHLYAGTSSYNIEERMLPMEMPTRPLLERFGAKGPTGTKTTSTSTPTAPTPDNFQFELQELDEHVIAEGNNKAQQQDGDPASGGEDSSSKALKLVDKRGLWKVEKLDNSKTWLKAFGDVNWAFCSLMAETYHTGRCDENDRLEDAPVPEGGAAADKSRVTRGDLDGPLPGGVDPSSQFNSRFGEGDHGAAYEEDDEDEVEEEEEDDWCGGSDDDEGSTAPDSAGAASGKAHSALGGHNSAPSNLGLIFSCCRRKSSGSPTRTPADAGDNADEGGE